MSIVTNLKSKAPRRQQYKEQIQLVSHGYSNPEAWPDGVITVFPWDNEIDEALVNLSKRASARNTMLYSIVEKLVDLNGASADDLVAEEVVTILLCARALSNNGVLMYQSRCPACAYTTEETVKVPHELEKISEKSKEYPGYDDIVLPVLNDIVRIRPLLVRDEKSIAEVISEKVFKSSESVLRAIAPIVSIGGGIPDNKQELIEWHGALHPTDVKFLADEERRITPRLSTTLKHECDRCGIGFEHTLSFDAHFFR